MKKGKRIVVIILITVLLIGIILFIDGYRRANSIKTEGIIVLAYHHFLPREKKEKYYKDNYYVMPTEQFEEQMKYLHDNGYVSIKPEVLECYLNNTCDIPEKSFLITIDDGNISSYYEVLPILEKNNYSAINFVISGRIKENVPTLEESDLNTFYYLDEYLLDDIVNNHQLMVIGSHSNNLHDQDKDGKKYYELKNYEELLDDSKKSKELLFDTKYLAYPYGSTNDIYKKAVKDAGFSMAFSFNNNKKVTRNSDLYELPRFNIRADMSLKDFSLIIENRISLKNYTKNLIKKIINK